MIQRIQTIYLLIAGLFPAITLFVPVILFGDPATNRWLTMSSLGYDATLVQEMVGRVPYGLLLFTVIAMVEPLMAIFGYKNRKRQLTRANIALSANILWYAAFAAYAWSVSSRLALPVSIEPAVAAPLLAVISLLLAKRGILRDEALVRAADRIR